MAKTPAQVIDVIKKGDIFRQLTDSSLAIEVANKAIHLFWTTYPWRDTIAELPPFYPIPSEADHVTPDIQIPTDFWGLYLVQVRNINGETYDLRVANTLPRASYTDWPQAIAYIPEISGFRLHPLPASSAPWVQIEGTYKKKPPTVTDDNFDTDNVPIDEMYLDVYEQAVRYKYFETLGDSRAGEVAYVRGTAQYTGQLGRYMATVQSAIGRENLHRGKQIDAPAEGLATGGFQGYTGWGW